MHYIHSYHAATTIFTTGGHINVESLVITSLFSSRAHQLNKLSIISPMHTIRSRLLSNKFTTHGTNAATQKPLSPLFHTVVIYIQLPTKKTPLSRPIPYTTQRDRNLISQKSQPNQIPNPHLAHFLPLNPSSTHPTKRGRCTPLGPRGPREYITPLILGTRKVIYPIEKDTCTSAFSYPNHCHCSCRLHTATQQGVTCYRQGNAHDSGDP